MCALARLRTFGKQRELRLMRQVGAKLVAAGRDALMCAPDGDGCTKGRLSGPTEDWPALVERLIA